MPTRTVPTLDLPDTTALDDAFIDEADALTNSWSSAVARAIGRAEREEKRSHAIATRVAAKRAVTDYTPIPVEIQDHLAAYPAF